MKELRGIAMAAAVMLVLSAGAYAEVYTSDFVYAEYETPENNNGVTLEISIVDTDGNEIEEIQLKNALRMNSSVELELLNGGRFLSLSSASEPPKADVESEDYAEGTVRFKWSAVGIGSEFPLTAVVELPKETYVVTADEGLRLLHLAGIRVDEEVRVTGVKAIGADGTAAEFTHSEGGFSVELASAPEGVLGLSYETGGLEGYIELPLAELSSRETERGVEIGSGGEVCLVRFEREGETETLCAVYRGSALGTLPEGGWAVNGEPYTAETEINGDVTLSYYVPSEVEPRGAEGEGTDEPGEEPPEEEEDAPGKEETDPAEEEETEEEEAAAFLELRRGAGQAYMNGRGPGVFAPDERITRAECAVLFYRCLTEESAASLQEATRFYDVPAGTWYHEAVSLLASAGVVGGRAQGYYVPGDSITRAEFVTMALRVLGVGPDGGAPVFTDSGASWASGYINAAAKLGLVGGYPDGSFRPGEGITRAEASAVMNKLLGRSMSAGISVAAPEWDDVPSSAWYSGEVALATGRFVPFS